MVLPKHRRIHPKRLSERSITTPLAVAKTPVYYITGDVIRIYPGEKFTADNTALWF